MLGDAFAYRKKNKYDRIFVDIPSRQVPLSLMASLAPNGRLVFPYIGFSNKVQLITIHKSAFLKNSPSLLKHVQPVEMK